MISKRLFRAISRGAARMCAVVLLWPTFSYSAVRQPVSRNVRSIRDWVSCDPTRNELNGTRDAIRAASKNSFELIVDCPVLLHIGSNIEAPIFIEDGTTVRMRGAGRFIIDNVMVPALVLANTANVNLISWHIDYVGKMPTNPDVGGYWTDAGFVSSTGHAQPAAAFNDLTLSAWIRKNRGVEFDRSKGRVSSPWTGPTSTSAIFYLVGQVKNVTISNLFMAASVHAKPDQFIPTAIQSSPGFKSNTTVDRDTMFQGKELAVPSRVHVLGLTLDGALMGWVGQLRDSTIRNVVSLRYADLQAEDGSDIGGVRQWFAPPHLFYFSPGGFGSAINQHLLISNVRDVGLRVGRPRPPSSGDARSLKFGGQNSRIEHYQSNRPDGFLDVLSSEQTEFDDLNATFDSSFAGLDNAGVRFPTGGLKNIRFTGVVLRDLAAYPRSKPIGDIADVQTTGVTFRNVDIALKGTGNNANERPVMASGKVIPGVREIQVERRD